MLGRTVKTSSLLRIWRRRPPPAARTTRRRRRDMCLKARRHPCEAVVSSKSNVACFILVLTAVLQVWMHAVSVMMKKYSSPFCSKYSAKPIAVQISSSSGPPRLLHKLDLSQYTIGPQYKFSITPIDWDYYQEYDKEEEDECVWMHEWQTRIYPTCNTMHESSFSSLDNSLKHVDRGSVRDVFEMTSEWDGTRWALKVLRIDNDFGPFRFRGQRKDSVVAERLSPSKYVASIFQMCGLSSLYEFASEGTLHTNYRSMTRSERMDAAVQVSRALADVHSFGSRGDSPAIAHADMIDKQFVKLHGRYQLNDFNLSFLLKWNTTSNRTCKRETRKIAYFKRPPEEMRDEWNWLDEKVDIYFLGNIFYQLLTNHYPYQGLVGDAAAKALLSGVIPRLPKELEYSKDVFVVALKKAANMTLVLNPEKRPTARKVADYIYKQSKLFEKQEARTKKFLNGEKVHHHFQQKDNTMYYYE